MAVAFERVPTGSAGYTGPVLHRSSVAVDARPTTPHSTAYAAAVIELYSRLWLQLEQLTHTLQQRGAQAALPALEQRLLRFKMEVALLLEACASARWTVLMRPEQRSALRAMLEELLGLGASAWPFVELQAIEQSQDALLDQILRHCRQPQGLNDVPSRVTGAQSSTPIMTLDDLITA